MISLLALLPPGTLMIFGALLLYALPQQRDDGDDSGCVLGWVALVLPVLSFLHMEVVAAYVPNNTVQWSAFGMELTPVRFDSLSLIFGWVFHLAAFLSALFALHVRDRSQQVAGQIYAGAAIAAVFAGDLLTLFVFWELTAVSSVFLIWARRTPQSQRAGLRYLIVQVGSGVILLAGILFWFSQTGSLDFQTLGFLSFDDWSELTLPAALILVAFGIKAAFPFLHNWLQDAYPNSTATGTVFLSAFTTKLAIYALARGFAGTDILIVIGCVMTVFPIFFAVIENDLRKVLAYSLNNQLGFMVVGIGVADFVSSPGIAHLALNGAVAHAFAHIIYKGLLFMAMGAVMHRVGTTKASELGGLYKSMPWTAVFCVIGAMSISAFPLMSGFTTKGLTMTAVGQAHLVIPSLVLLFASAGVMEHSGIKIPFFAFFGHDSGKRVAEAPRHMLIAMGLAAALCVFIGVFPQSLYSMLPFEMIHGTDGFVFADSVGAQIAGYHNYTASHVFTQLQLLMFAILAFGVLMRSGIYPSEKPSTVLDFDWVYRRAIPRALSHIGNLCRAVNRLVMPEVRRWSTEVSRVFVARFDEKSGQMGQTHPTGTTALWAALLLCAFLILYYL